jgi:hypothetical protein
MANDAQEELVAIIHFARERYLLAMHQALRAGLDPYRLDGHGTLHPHQDRWPHRSIDLRDGDRRRKNRGQQSSKSSPHTATQVPRSP